MHQRVTYEPDELDVDGRVDSRGVVFNPTGPGGVSPTSAARSASEDHIRGGGMSPWGRFYLENFIYSPGWEEPFSSWRMWGILDIVIARWAPTPVGNWLHPVESPAWRRVSAHLDALSYQLRHSSWRYSGKRLSPDWKYPDPCGPEPSSIPEAKNEHQE